MLAPASYNQSQPLRLKSLRLYQPRRRRERFAQLAVYRMKLQTPMPRAVCFSRLLEGGDPGGCGGNTQKPDKAPPWAAMTAVTRSVAQLRHGSFCGRGATRI